MSIAGLADLVLRNPVLAEAMADSGRLSTLDLTGPAALRPFVVKGLVDAGRTVLVVAATAREAEDLVEVLGDVLDPARVGYYPAWETLPHERLSPRSDTVGRRLAVLRRLRHPGTDEGNGPLDVVVAPVRSVLQPQVQGLADLEPVELAVGDSADLDDVVRRLADAAYSRVDLVEKRGEFAVRGGIVDVFPPTEEHPLRVEFLGDDIEEIRSFAVADQRTLEPVQRLWAPPCRELLLTDDVRAPGQGARRRAPRAGRDHRPDGRGRRRRGHGVAGPGARRRDGDAGRPAAGGDPRAAARPRAGAHAAPTTWWRPARSSSGVSWAAAAGGGQAPIDLGAASLREIGDVGSDVLGAGQGVVERQPVRSRRRHRRGQPRRSTYARPRSTAATSSGRSPTSGAGSPTAAGWCCSARATARRSGWSRCSASTTCRPGWSSRLDSRTVPTARARRGHRHLRLPRPRLRRRRPLRLAVLTREDLLGQRASTARHAQDADPAQEADRPAGAQGRRLRRPRAARRRPLRRDEAARVPGRDARVPRARVRLQQARPARRPALRARPTRSTRSPATSAASSRRSTGSAAATGPSARAAPARRCARSPPS